MAEKTEAQRQEENKNIEKVIYETLEEDLKKDNEKDFSDLYNAAYLFLINMNKLNSDENKIAEHQEMVKSLIDSIKSQSIPKIDNNYKIRQESSYIQEALVLTHSFENELNKYLNRRIFLTYVNDKGEIIAFNEAATESLYSKISEKSPGIGSISLSRTKISELTGIQNNNDNIISNINEQISKIASRKNKVYLKAIKRYDEELGKKHKHGLGKDNNNKNYYYWNIKKGEKTESGHTEIIANRGFIAEGYASAVINEDKEVNNNNINSSLKRLWEAHIKSDSIEAAIKGDIIRKFIRGKEKSSLNQEDTSLQFAIKSGSAGTASIRPYLYLARNIIKLNSSQWMHNKALFKLALPLLIKENLKIKIPTNLEDIQVGRWLNKTVDTIAEDLKNTANDTVGKIIINNLLPTTKSGQTIRATNIDILQQVFNINI